MKKVATVLLAFACGAPVFGQLHGILDHAGCDTISGWAWDSSQPNTPIYVTVYEVNQGQLSLLSTVLASNYRTDLAAYGNGQHAFSVVTPNSIRDGNTHSLAVYAGLNAPYTPLLVYGSQNLNCGAGAVGYQPYFADALNSVDGTKWRQNGSVSTGSNGLTSASSGSLISTVAIPDGTSNYEARATLKLASSGGNYYLYLRASPDSIAGSGTGTYYAAQFSNPTVTGSSCSGTLSVLASISGTITQLVSTAMTCHSGMELRAVILSNNYITVYADGVMITATGPGATVITSGKPGVGVSSAPASNSITNAFLGPNDTLPPNTIDPNLVGTSLLPNRVDMQWPAPVDDSHGTGIAWYQILKNGAWIKSTTSPAMSDTAVQPGTTYTYSLQAIDYHWNSTTATIQVTTPPASSIDPRQVGVRPTGSYWGGIGERIDMRSGNVNYNVPLLKALGRGGFGVSLGLNYNSQNWRQDPPPQQGVSPNMWQLGRDTGYGYGWKLQVGSITPIYAAYWTVDHYLFVDGSGAEYKLDQATTDENSDTVWRSKEGIYVTYVPAKQRLYFNNGTFWVFGCVSAAPEQDAGTMYPTLIEDTNGNQVLIRYNNAAGTQWPDSSSRIQVIEDARAIYDYGTGLPTATYAFAFNTDTIPHLTSITDSVGSGETYSFTYNTQQLNPPFTGGHSFGNWMFLQTVNQTASSLTTTFGYDSSGSGELARVTLPYQGYLRWTYATYTFTGSRSIREMQNRYVAYSAGDTEHLTTLGRDPNDLNRTANYWADLVDQDAHSNKVWIFETDTTLFNLGLVKFYQEREMLPAVKTIQQVDSVWSRDAAGNPYLYAAVTQANIYTANQADKQVIQTLDASGNVTDLYVYEFGNLSTPVRTYHNNYLTDVNYAKRYIRNRVSSSTVTDGTKTVTLVSNIYDGNGTYAPADVPGIREHDFAYGTTFAYRGNVTSSTSPEATVTRTYDIGGNVTGTTVNGVTTKSTLDGSKNWTVPSQITTNSLTESLGWSTFLGLTSDTGPNGDVASTQYRVDGRPWTSTSVYGAVTTFSYNDSVLPATVTATTNGHYAKTTKDGLGRTVFSETGAGSTAMSIVDTVYAPCGCTPTGKVKKVSQPYAPGGTKYWTVYNYDALGRTTSIVAADGASTTTYSYAGNKVTVTDPAGKTKTFTMNALGQIAQVSEPRPGSGTYTTSYTYDVLGHLTDVSMPRDGYTQTRHFNYLDTGGNVKALLQSATNPENGTVSYTYDTQNRLVTKTDAKAQVLSYGYDSYNRLQTVKQGSTTLRTYYYDSNPLDGSFTANGLGRLTAIQYLSSPVGQFTDMFSYNVAGQVTVKRLKQTATGYGNGGTSSGQTMNLDVTYQYDIEGAPSSVAYPNTATLDGSYLGRLVTTYGPSYTYSFDSLRRPSGMTEQRTQASVVSGVQYGPANELTQVNYFDLYETRGYNNLLQTTSLKIGNYSGGANVSNLTYTFSATQNNGKISKQKDNLSGEEVQYTYDTLNRLATAGTTGDGWGQSFTYDGFGNLTAESVTKGSAPYFTQPVDPATNRVGPASSYDANGNMVVLPATGFTAQYDVENRMTSAHGMQYGYDAGNHRIWKWDGTRDSYGNPMGLEVWFYGADGRLLGQYTSKMLLSLYNQVVALAPSAAKLSVYFGGKLVGRGTQNGDTGVQVSGFKQDRLGSAVKTFPYGDEKPPTTGDDAFKFATYWRDSATSLDYAVNRYYSWSWGRFTSPDPYVASGGPADPGSWNRYAYVGGDPVNFADQNGLKQCLVGAITTAIFGVSTTSLLWETCPDLAAILVPPSPAASLYSVATLLAIQQMDTHPSLREISRQLAYELSCDKNIRDAMKVAWAQSGNGTSGAEAGFRVDGDLNSFTVNPSAYTNERGQMTVSISSSTFALFHVHPNGSGGAPSTPTTSANGVGDTGMADNVLKANDQAIDVFVISKLGLYFYDPVLKQTQQLQKGLDWTKPCP